MSEKIVLVGGNRCGERIELEYPGEEKDAASGYRRRGDRDRGGRDVYRVEKGRGRG